MQPFQKADAWLCSLKCRQIDGQHFVSCRNHCFKIDLHTKVDFFQDPGTSTWADVSSFSWAVSSFQMFVTHMFDSVHFRIYLPYCLFPTSQQHFLTLQTHFNISVDAML